MDTTSLRSEAREWTETREWDELATTLDELTRAMRRAGTAATEGTGWMRRAYLRVLSPTPQEQEEGAVMLANLEGIARRLRAEATTATRAIRKLPRRMRRAGVAPVSA
jgi:hypothetical protein